MPSEPQSVSSAELLARRGSRTCAYFRGSSKPYVRWWWLSGPFTREDIARQLEWVRDRGFGGVELAWLQPGALAEPDGGARPVWLGREWTELVEFTSQCADSLGLGCDFTFGSCWPFGGSWVSAEDSSQTFYGPSSQRLEGSWEDAQHGPTRVVEHLNRAALGRYSEPLLAALRGALAGRPAALFCDSLELVTEGLWSPALWNAFEARFGYSIEPFIAQLHAHPDVRYDYRRLIDSTIRREFYEAFTAICRANGAYSRVQCHGAPADLIAAYAAADVPESESLLFPPAFSRIAASAGAWAGKPAVSAETFTCMHGFPMVNPGAVLYWKKENVADLKLLADSLFANGVNQIVWHGMPYQPAGKSVEFYASVHVGPDSPLAPHLPQFNAYLESVSSLLKLGTPYAGLGVYLPWEDALMADRIPPEERTPGANYRWEMRHAAPPAETEGFHPVWVSGAVLQEAVVEYGWIRSRELRLHALYVDCAWLDAASLRELLRLARQGARIVIKRPVRQPGHHQEPDYLSNLDLLADTGAMSTKLSPEGALISGDDLPWYWARLLDEDLLVFFAHPKARQIRYPMPWGFSLSREATETRIQVRWGRAEHDVCLRFEPYQSLAMLFARDGSVQNIDIRYIPPDPLQA